MADDAPAPAAEAKTPIVCGLVMPISETGGLGERHWLDVRRILTDALSAAGFNARMVSEAREMGVIHKRIVQNLLTDPMVVCDVSCLNPNVMFELGVRLTFDQPTVIVKDFDTPFKFDTGVIEHVQYRRDLRYQDIADFKVELAEKVRATYEAKQKDPNYSVFIKHFGEFKVPKPGTTEVPGWEVVQSQLADLERKVTAASVNRNDEPRAPRRESLELDRVRTYVRALIRTKLAKHPEMTHRQLFSEVYEQASDLSKLTSGTVGELVREEILTSAFDQTSTTGSQVDG
jgi:hypothetical protein